MKNTFKLVLLASLVVFASACGKKNESGGSGSYGNLVSDSSQLSDNSIDAVKNFTRWMDTNIPVGQANNLYGNVALFYQSSSAIGDVGSNCVEKEFLGIPYYYCSGYSSNSGTTGDSCKVTILGGVQTRAVKLQNPTLNKIYNASANKLVLINATQTNPSSYLQNVYTLSFQDQRGNATSNPEYGTVKSYTIDTQYHSAIQPMVVTENNSGSYKRLSQISYNLSGVTDICGVE